MKISIIGGGNIGTQFAVHSAAKGHQTTVLTSKPELFSDTLEIVDNDDNVVLSASGVRATNSYANVCKDADLIFVTHPAHLMREVAENIYKNKLTKGAICLVPGTGGGECAFGKFIEEGIPVLGLQRVPSVARIVKYGEKVRCTGYRNTLHLGTVSNAYMYTEIISKLFDMPCVALPNYLSVTLTPSNPILHTTRLYTLFRDYKEGMSYDSIPLFYEDWSDETSELLFKCDDEVQAICKSLRNFDLSNVKSLKEHYESNTPEKLTTKIRSISSFKGIPTPSVKKDNKWYPDFSSRYFTADFPFGLSIIVQIAHFANVAIPNCEMILDWYKRITSVDEFSYADYGIKDLKDFESFYLKK